MCVMLNNFKFIIFQQNYLNVTVKYLIIKAFNMNVRHQMRGPLLKLCNKSHYPFDSQKFSLQF